MTTKSRMFSQISASVRPSRVPSPTCTWISCSIAMASGNVALRANMGGSCKYREYFLRLLQRRPNLHGSSAPRYVVDGQYLLQLQCIIELRIGLDRKSTRLNSSHLGISYAVFCLK